MKINESHGDDSAAILVGRLVRSYRDEARRNGRRLSQEGLLDLMAERGEGYAADLDRSSLSRWESGARLAPREFLVALGRSLNVPKPEIDRLLSLAGYETLGDEEGRVAMLAAAQSIELQVESLQREVRSLMDSAGPSEPPADAYGVARDALRRFALPGVYALVVGFVLNALGLNGTLALLGLRTGRVRNRDWPGRLEMGEARPATALSMTTLWTCSSYRLFFTLNAPLLIGVLTKADHFGFYTIKAFTSTPMPFLFTILANLVLSLVASIMFSVLWRRQQGSDGRRSAFESAVWTTLPPLLFTYISIFIFTNLGAWISFMVIFVILFGAFTTIVALSEPGISLGDVNFVLKAAIAVMIVLCSFGVAGALVAYVDTDTALTAASIRIIPLREISAEELGYSPEEGVKLLRLGSLWMSLTSISYLVTVVGGYLLVTIRRTGSRPGTGAKQHFGQDTGAPTSRP